MVAFLTHKGGCISISAKTQKKRIINEYGSLVVFSFFRGTGFRVPTIDCRNAGEPLVNRRCCRPVARADGREGPRCSPVVALEVGRAEEAWRAAQEVSRTRRSAFGAKRALSSLGFAGFLARHGVDPHAHCLARAFSGAHAHATLPSLLADFCVPPLLRTQLLCPIAQAKRRWCPPRRSSMRRCSSSRT